MRKWIAIVVCGFMYTPAQAYMARGNGASSCGTYLQERNQPVADSVLGFLSGYNAFAVAMGQGDFLSETLDRAALNAWLENYCRAHPLDLIAEAADKLGAELSHRAQRTSTAK